MKLRFINVRKRFTHALINAENRYKNGSEPNSDSEN